MKLRRLLVLMAKDLRGGTTNFIFIFAVITPLLLTLLLTVLFGSAFSSKAKLGLVDSGDSAIYELLVKNSSLRVSRFGSLDDLYQAVEQGDQDLGIHLPTGLDRHLETGENVTIDALVWGESMAKNRMIAWTAVTSALRQISDSEQSIELVTVTLGDENTITMKDRTIPLVILLAVVMSGVMVPASMLVEEKQQRTINALISTPVSYGEVVLTKGFIGWALSVLVAIIVLSLNRVWGAHSGLLVLVLALGAMLSALGGVLLGMNIADTESLFATIKGIGIFLYAPALIYMFPTLPQWIGKVFPTYYIVSPVIALIQENATWADISTRVMILALVIVAASAIVIWTAAKKQRKAQV